MKLQTYSITDIGRMRRENEDCLKCDSENKVFVIADGMGGHVAGKIASSTAVEKFHSEISRILKDSKLTLPFEYKSDENFYEVLIKYGYGQVNAAINTKIQKDSSLQGMGTTMSVVIIVKNQVHIGHIGDSRVYLFRNSQISQLTRDHSLAEQMIQNGILKREERNQFKGKNIILKALGPKEAEAPDYIVRDLEPNDLFLMCTDGVHNYFEEDSLISFFEKKDENLEKIGKKIVKAANEKGGQDNISLVLIRVKEIET